MSWYFDFLIEHGFNAIRLPFNHVDVLNDKIVDRSESRYASSDWDDFGGIHYIGMLKSIIADAAEKGLMVMLVATQRDRVPLKTPKGVDCGTVQTYQGQTSSCRGKSSPTPSVTTRGT